MPALPLRPLRHVFLDHPAADEKPLDRLIDELVLAAGHAEEVLDEEAGGEPRIDDPLPEISIIDAAGRPVTGLRLDHEPGTARFAIVLLTAAAGEGSGASS